MASKAAAVAAVGSPSTVAPPPEMTENIAYMTLMHELKAAFPNISDEAVKQCVLEVSKNKCLCKACKSQLRVSEAWLFCRASSRNLAIAF